MELVTQKVWQSTRSEAEALQDGPVEVKKELCVYFRFWRCGLSELPVGMWQEYTAVVEADTGDIQGRHVEVTQS